MSEQSTPNRQLSEEEIEQLRAIIRDRAAHMSEDDLRKLLGKEQQIRGKLSGLGDQLPRLRKQLKVGLGMVRDYWKGDYRSIPFWSVASVAAALGYFLTPTDLIPDFLPIIGYLDDAAVMAAVMAGIREDLKRYCDAKGIQLEE